MTDVHAIHTDGSAELLKGIVGWSITEEATPLAADDTSGSVGGFTVTFAPNGVTPAELKVLRQKVINLDDEGQGRTTGKAESIATQSGIPVLTVQSRLNLLSVQRKAKPYNGDLLGALTYYLGLVGITDMSTVYVDPDLALQPVSLVGWYQPVWNQLKKMGQVYGFEVALVSDKIVVRKPRTRIGQQYRDSGVEWAVDDSQKAQRVQIYYYEAFVATAGENTLTHDQVESETPGDTGGLLEPTYQESISHGLVYPAGGWNKQVEVLTVNSGETKTVQIDLGASVTNVQQPQCVRLVGPYQVPGISCYTITKADGTPMVPSEWVALGGKVKVKVNDDSVTATLTITGAKFDTLGPFSLSLSDGTNDFSTLRLLGDGIAYTKKMLDLQTGVSVDLASTDVGATVDNEFVQSEAQAWDLAAGMIGRYSGPRQTISVTTTGINRIGDSGSYDFEPLSWLSGQIPAGMTLADLGDWLNSQSGGTTLADASAWVAGQNADGFTNQAFGNLAGARVIHDGSWYRIVTATIGPDTISYTATMDMTCGDLSAAFGPDMTVADISAAFAGKTLMDWDARPVPNGVSA